MEKHKVEVEIIYTDGWQERFTKAAYKLYLRAREDERKQKAVHID